MKFNPKTRQFTSVEDMNESLIRMWNSVAQPGDIIYILGDVAFMQSTAATKIVQRLNGEKILITGNHDSKLLKDKKFRDEFTAIYPYYELRLDEQKYCLFHFPIAEWNQCHRGAIHLHGHLHGNPSGLEEFKAIDVGYDATGKIMISVAEVLTIADARKIKKHGDSKTDNMV